MSLVDRFPRPPRATLAHAIQSTVKNRIDLLKRLNNFFRNIYSIKFISEQFLILSRDQPLSILVPIQRRQAGRGV